MLFSNNILKVIILSPSVHSEVTKKCVENMLQENNIKIDAVVFRKIGGLYRIKEELKLGVLSLIFKIFFKLLIPLISRFFYLEKQNTYRNIKINYVQNFNSEIALNWIKARSPDLIVFTGGGILKKELLDIPKLGVLNCHLGVLPKYRGMYPYVWAILEDEWDQIGCTTHFMDAGIDTGPILEVFKFKDAIKNYKNIGSYLEAQIPECLISSLRLISKNKHNPKNQLESDGIQYFIPHKNLLNEVKNKIDRR